MQRGRKYLVNCKSKFMEHICGRNLKLSLIKICFAVQGYFNIHVFKEYTLSLDQTSALLFYLNTLSRILFSISFIIVKNYTDVLYIISNELIHYLLLVSIFGDGFEILPLHQFGFRIDRLECCLLYTSPSPRDGLLSRMPSSA